MNTNPNTVAAPSNFEADFSSLTQRAQDYINTIVEAGIEIDTTVITGGADTQVLFNNSGKVGSNAAFTFNPTTAKLALNADLELTSGKQFSVNPGNGASWYYSSGHIFSDAFNTMLVMARGNNPVWDFQGGNVGGVNYKFNSGHSTSTKIVQIANGAPGAIPFEILLAASQSANAIEVRTSDNVLQSGFDHDARIFGRSGAAVASAAAITPTGNVFHVTGTTNITSITSTNVKAGTVITIIFDAALTFTDGNNLKLAGNFVTTADDTITLVYDGTNWYEVSRSAN